MYICVNVISYVLIFYVERNLLKYNVSELVDINIFIMHYVLTTVLDRLDAIEFFFFCVTYSIYILINPYNQIS